PRFGDVEVVDIEAHSPVGDGSAQSVEADGGDPSLHRLIVEHRRVRQRELLRQRVLRGGGQGYAPDPECRLVNCCRGRGLGTEQVADSSVAERQHARRGEIGGALVDGDQGSGAVEVVVVWDAGPSGGRFEVSTGGTVDRRDRSAGGDDDALAGAEAFAADLVEDRGAGAGGGGSGQGVEVFDGPGEAAA